MRTRCYVRIKTQGVTSPYGVLYNMYLLHTVSCLIVRGAKKEKTTEEVCQEMTNGKNGTNCTSSPFLKVR